MLSFTDSIAASLPGTGVRAIAICPGRIRTGRHLRAGQPDGLVETTAVVGTGRRRRPLPERPAKKAASGAGAAYTASLVTLLELPRRSLLVRLVRRGREQKVQRVCEATEARADEQLTALPR